MLLLQQMIVLFIYIVIGYAAAKKGVMNEETSKKLSWIVVEVAILSRNRLQVQSSQKEELQPCLWRWTGVSLVRFLK